MKITNFEFKARTSNLEVLEAKLQELSPHFIGEDHQIDTYFNVDQGRLKLREGTIENSLIYYECKNVSGSKQSSVLLYRHSPAESLKEILTKIHGVKVVVDKKRKIYFIDNVKFHFDLVKQLGTFVEVEAIDDSGNFTTDQLQQQCDHYASFFELAEPDFMEESYSDLLLSLSPH